MQPLRGSGPEFVKGALAGECLVGQVQSDHDRDAVCTHNPPTVSKSPHAIIEQSGRGEKVWAVLGRTGDLIFLAEDADSNRFCGLTHP
jgi:hypothetical protein